MSTSLAIEFIDLKKLNNNIRKKKYISDKFYLHVGKKILFVKYQVEEVISSETVNA